MNVMRRRSEYAQRTELRTCDSSINRCPPHLLRDWSISDFDLLRQSYPIRRLPAWTGRDLACPHSSRHGAASALPCADQTKSTSSRRFGSYVRSPRERCRYIVVCTRSVRTRRGGLGRKRKRNGRQRLWKECVPEEGHERKYHVQKQYQPSTPLS